MKLCSNCNELLDNTATVCSDCGNNLVPEAARPTESGSTASGGWAALERIERPTRAGRWVWYHPHGVQLAILQVRESDGRMQTYDWKKHRWQDVDFLGGLWAGPVKLPEASHDAMPPNDGTLRQEPRQ